MKLILHANKHHSFLQIDFNTLGITVSYKVILSLLMAMIKHSQGTQSNLDKEVRNGVHFLHEDKHLKFLQVGIIVFGESGQTCPK